MTPPKHTGVSPRAAAAARKVAEAEAVVQAAPKERNIAYFALNLQEALERQKADIYEISIHGQLDAESLGYCSRLEQTVTGIRWKIQGELARGLNNLVRQILLDVLLEPTHKHKRGGLYHLVGYSTHTETGALEAVYRDKDGELWHRPQAMFDDGRFEPMAGDAK